LACVCSSSSSSSSLTSSSVQRSCTQAGSGRLCNHIHMQDTCAHMAGHSAALCPTRTGPISVRHNR
jgi:hypothetical protein